MSEDPILAARTATPREAAVAKLLRGAGLPEEAIQRTLRVAELSVGAACAGLLGELFNGRLHGADLARAGILARTLEGFDPEQRTEAGRLLDSCSCVSKPAKLGTSMWRGREMFGDAHPEFCAMALDARLLLMSAGNSGGHGAASTPEAAACLRMLAKGARGAAPLLLAGAVCRPCFQPDPDALAVLAELGLPCSAPGPNEASPLWLCARQNTRRDPALAEASLRCARIALAAGCDASLPSGRGGASTPLQAAADAGNAGVALLLIQYGCDPFATPELAGSLAAMEEVAPALRALGEKSALGSTPPGPAAGKPRGL